MPNSPETQKLIDDYNTATNLLAESDAEDKRVRADDVVYQARADVLWGRFMGGDNGVADEMRSAFLAMDAQEERRKDARERNRKIRSDRRELFAKITLSLMQEAGLAVVSTMTKDTRSEDESADSDRKCVDYLVGGS